MLLDLPEEGLVKEIYMIFDLPGEGLKSLGDMCSLTYRRKVSFTRFNSLTYRRKV